MNALLFAMAFVIQTHTPTATVNGDVVTVAADFAYIDNAVGTAVVIPVAITQGTILADDNNMLASSDGTSPITWQLSPGTYKVTAFGYPDDRMSPMRTMVVLDVTIGSPTRQQQITDAVRAYSLATYDAAQALSELRTLKPTRAELLAALRPQTPFSN